MFPQAGPDPKQTLTADPVSSQAMTYSTPMVQFMA